MPTERETIARERAAFQRGAEAAHVARLGCERDHASSGFYLWCASPRTSARPVLDTDALRVTAFARYLLPKVPRVVADPDGNAIEWCVLDGEICSREAGDVDAEAWSTDDEFVVTPTRVAVWADLLATPTEDVDDDA